MGRSGIKRRKKRSASTKNRGVYREPDVIGDLEDQAQWSSYTQHIPRLGDEYREGLRLKRIYRFASGLTRPANRFGGDWPMAIGVTVLVGLAIAGGVWFLVAMIRLFI